MGHFHPRSVRRLALLRGVSVSKTWARSESTESTAPAKGRCRLCSAGWGPGKWGHRGLRPGRRRLPSPAVLGGARRCSAALGGPQRVSVLTKRPPARRPGRERDALGRVYTCCLWLLQGNILEMPPSAPWTNALLLPQSRIGCNKLLLQGVYRAL